MSNRIFVCCPEVIKDRSHTAPTASCVVRKIDVDDVATEIAEMDSFVGTQSDLDSHRLIVTMAVALASVSLSVSGTVDREGMLWGGTSTD